MELKISDLPSQFENIAIEIGIDKVCLLYTSDAADDSALV